MCDQSTACNTHCHIRHRHSIIKRMHQVTPGLIQHTQYCHRSTMSNVTLKYTPVRKRAPLTTRRTRSNSLRCVSAAAHRTADSTPNRGGQNPESISEDAIYHGILEKTSPRYHVFKKLLWKSSEDASQRSSWKQMSLPIYRCHQCSFRTVPPIVNRGDWGFIVSDLETIIVLLAFNFIPQKSHHLLTMPRSQIRHSATLTLVCGWHNSHQSGVTGIIDKIIFQNGKKLRRSHKPVGS